MFALKKLPIAIVLIVLAATAFSLATRRKRRKQKAQPLVEQTVKKDQTTKQQDKSILFNLNGVLIKEDTSSVLSKVGFGRMLGYTLTHWRNPIDSCLDVLEKMSTEPDQKCTVNFKYKNRKMPRCIIEWQQGKCAYENVKKELEQYVAKLDENNFFSSVKEKEITQSIMNIALNPDELPDIAKPITPMFNLVQELKNKGYKLYIFANAPPGAISFMKKTYPDLMNSFDGIVVSAEVKALKPEKKMFKHLFNTYKLDPKQCIMIDNEFNSLEAAETFGMKGITFTNAKAVKNQLKKLGIV